MSIIKLKSNFQTNPTAFKLYPLFVAIYIILQIECVIFVTKQIEFWGFDITLSGITFPINILLLGIVTNSYGYQLARQLLWINNIVLLQFIIFNSLANLLPFSNIMVHNEPNLILSYNVLIPKFIHSSLVALFAENIAEFIFIWLVNRKRCINRIF